MAQRAMLDTNIVSELMRNQRSRLWERTRSHPPDSLCVSIIVAAELRFGAALQGSAHRLAEVNDILGLIAVVPFESPADGHYADIRASLHRAGTPIGPNDLFIAAHALALDLTLVTANVREFSRVPGLRVENWLD